MESFQNNLATWSSILGTVLGLLSMLQSSPWLADLSLLFLSITCVALLYAWRERLRLRLAAVTIEGRSIDSLSVANVHRRLNRSLVVQEADQVATILGEDLVVTWRYSGFCRAANEAAVEFSIDMDTHIPFDQLDCVAYDLRNDPGRTHSIRPVLLGSDGISKKVAVPLLAPLSEQDPFSVVLRCVLPGCMKGGVDYYASTASITQPQISNYTIRLVFLRDRPAWVRVYECDPRGSTRLLKDLRPSSETARRADYVDVADGHHAQAARIYVFQRPEKLQLRKHRIRKRVFSGL